MALNVQPMYTASWQKASRCVGLNGYHCARCYSAIIKATLVDVKRTCIEDDITALLKHN
jgi:hypothetical protein